MKLRIDQAAGGLTYWMWCPACDSLVRISDAWAWNGDVERPTFTPSLLTTTGAEDERVCHAYVTDGSWHYLPDSTHADAGRSLGMADLPDWMASGPILR